MHRGEQHVKIKTAVCSFVGDRKINQDNFYINGFYNQKYKSKIKKTFSPKNEEQVLAVSDGMGGEQHGEIAAKTAMQVLHQYHKKYLCFEEDFKFKVQEYIQGANDAVCRLMHADGKPQCGAAVSVLCIFPQTQKATAFNVGDCKVMLFRNGNIHQISRDHNAAQTLVDVGLLTKEQARCSKEKSYLTQHLGIMPEEMIIEPYVSETIILQKGDIFLLCSDGLTDALTDTALETILKKRMSIQRKCKKLVYTAHRNGSKDNITLIISKIQ